jgi:GDP-L-fucose synthase
MGIQLIEADQQEVVQKFMTLCTVCKYQKFAPFPFKEEDLWDGYPEETNDPYCVSKKMLLVMAKTYGEQYFFNVV